MNGIETLPKIRKEFLTAQNCLSTKGLYSDSRFDSDTLHRKNATNRGKQFERNDCCERDCVGRRGRHHPAAGGFFSQLVRSGENHWNGSARGVENGDVVFAWMFAELCSSREASASSRTSPCRRWIWPLTTYGPVPKAKSQPATRRLLPIDEACMACWTSFHQKWAFSDRSHNWVRVYEPWLWGVHKSRIIVT